MKKAKKKEVSNLYDLVGQVSTHSAPAYTLEPTLAPVVKITKSKNYKAVESDKRKGGKNRVLIKPQGRPAKYDGDLKRQMKTVPMRIVFCDKIEKMQSKKVSFADVLDSILEKHFLG
jgi:phage-related protein